MISTAFLRRFGARSFVGDGIDDIVIGAARASPNEVELAGSSYIVFGRSSGFQSVLSLADLNGVDGFRF